MNGLVKAVILVSCLVILLPLVVGCSGEKTEETDVILGWIGDSTGPAQAAITPIYSCVEDYLRMVEEDNLLPGIKFKLVTYDTRTDWGRLPTGYATIKNKGAQVLLIPNQGEVEVLATKLQNDKIPTMTVSASQALLGNPWVFFMSETIEDHIALVMKWMVEDWESAERGPKPRIGHVGTDTIVGSSHRAGIDDYLEANPNTIDWMGHKAAPLTTTSWVGEITPLMTCDYIVISMVGPGTASFINEARNRGFSGKIVSGTTAIPGYWNLVKSAVPPNHLYELYHMHNLPWVGDNPYANAVRTLIERYRPQEYVDTQLGQASYQVGYAWGIWLIDVIKRASEAVGIESLDGTAIRQALRETDLAIEGWGNQWTLSEQNHICAPTMRMYKWSIQDSEWQAVGDWMSPE